MKKAEDEKKMNEILSVMQELKVEKTSMIGIGISSEILIAFIQAQGLILNGESIQQSSPYRFKPYQVPAGGTVVQCSLEYGQNMVSFQYRSNLSYSNFIFALSQNKLMISTLYSMSIGTCSIIVDGVPHTMHHRETLDLPDIVNHIEVVFSS